MFDLHLIGKIMAYRRICEEYSSSASNQLPTKQTAADDGRGAAQSIDEHASDVSM